jgi:hypothetical protein
MKTARTRFLGVAMFLMIGFLGLVYGTNGAILTPLSDNFGGGVSGTMTRNALLKSVGDSKVANSAIIDNGTTVAISENVVVTGSISSTGGGASRALTTPITLTATSPIFQASASTADAVQVFQLPQASTVPGKQFCFAADTITGSNREIDIESQGASDVIIATTNATGGTGIAATAGPGHGMKNTHATAVRGNFACLHSDGGVLWMATALDGTWAAY